MCTYLFYVIVLYLFMYMSASIIWGGNRHSERSPGSGARRPVLVLEVRLRYESTMKSCPRNLIPLILSPVSRIER